MTTISDTVSKQKIERHVVLYEPDVHWNTGNIGRTCVGVGAALHLIEPLGFCIDDKHVKRAGLDYWHKVNLFTWKNFDAFMNALKPEDSEIMLLSKTGKKTFWQLPENERLFLIFGSETRGLPESVFSRFPGRSYHIPILSGIRSLNLSTSVGIVLYESLRSASPFHEY